MSSSTALLLALSLWATAANAEPSTLRFAAISPEGTSWARLFRGFGYDVKSESQGDLQVKWYFAGIAGDELTVFDRIKRGQIDGTASAGGCERLAPSLRVTRLIGLVHGRDELKHLMGRMRARIDAEMAKSGFVDLGLTPNGTAILLTRRPVASMEDLRKMRLWVWTEDDLIRKALERLGVQVFSTDLSEAGRAFTDGRVDGFVTIPLGALAFQWSTLARYYTELPVSSLPGCLVMSQRRFDALPIEQQRLLRSAGTKVALLFDDASRAEENALLDRLFERQGMKRVPLSATFRSQFFQEARLAREAVAPSVVSPALVNEVLGWLADFRAEHADHSSDR